MAPKAAPAKAEHASYQDMITDAIVNLKDRNGSSRIALKKYVKANNKINAADRMFDSLFNRALKAGVEKGAFEQPKGSSGGTKLKKRVPVPKEAKTVEKKAAAPKKAPAKKVTAVTKKAAAPKKAVAAPAKKVAVKKAAPPKEAVKEKAPVKAKKAAAPKAKAAPAITEKPTILGKTKSGRVTKTTAKTVTTTPAPKKAAKKAITPKKTASASKKAAAST